MVGDLWIRKGILYVEGKEGKLVSAHVLRISDRADARAGAGGSGRSAPAPLVEDE